MRTERQSRREIGVATAGTSHKRAWGGSTRSGGAGGAVVVAIERSGRRRSGGRDGLATSGGRRGGNSPTGRWRVGGRRGCLVRCGVACVLRRFRGYGGVIVTVLWDHLTFTRSVTSGRRPLSERDLQAGLRGFAVLSQALAAKRETARGRTDDRRCSLGSPLSALSVFRRSRRSRRQDAGFFLQG